MAAVRAAARRELDDGHNLTLSVWREQLANDAARMRIAAFPTKIALWADADGFNALAEMLLDSGLGRSAMSPMLARIALLLATLLTVVRTPYCQSRRIRKLAARQLSSIAREQQSSALPSEPLKTGKLA